MYDGMVKLLYIGFDFWSIPDIQNNSNASKHVNIGLSSEKYTSHICVWCYDNGIY